MRTISFRDFNDFDKIFVTFSTPTHIYWGECFGGLGYELGTLYLEQKPLTKENLGRKILDLIKSWRGEYEKNTSITVRSVQYIIETLKKYNKQQIQRQAKRKEIYGIYHKEALRRRLRTISSEFEIKKPLESKVFVITIIFDILDTYAGGHPEEYAEAIQALIVPIQKEDSQAIEPDLTHKISAIRHLARQLLKEE